MRFQWTTAGLVCVVLASSAGAHTSTSSTSRWQLAPDGARVELRIDTSALEYRPPGVSAEEYLAAALELRTATGPCRPSTPKQIADTAGNVVFSWRCDCQGDAPAFIRSSLFDGMVTTHTHVATIVADGGPSRKRVLTAQTPAWPIATPGDAAPAAWWSHVVLGLEHILGGWDHLAFVIALVLLAPTLRETALLVTGFTIAHSITLAAATLSWVRPEPPVVECLIGFSIALIGAENCWLLADRRPAIKWAVMGLLGGGVIAGFAGATSLGTMAWLGLLVFTLCHFGLLERTSRPALLRFLIVFAFGLAHGFGFAGILVNEGLPRSEVIPALLGFNAGVELGQLAVVAAGFAAMWMLARIRATTARRLIAEIASAGVTAAGVYWLVVRGGM